MNSTADRLRVLIAVSMTTLILAIGGGVAGWFGEQKSLWMVTFAFIGAMGKITHTVLSSLDRRLKDLETRVAENGSRDTN